jgi:hypothetical protein
VSPDPKTPLSGPSRPLGSPEIPQFHLPSSGGKGVYAPRLYGAATIHFGDKRRRVDERRKVAFLVPLEAATKTVDWESAKPTTVTPDQLLKDSPVRTSYQPLPAGSMELKTFTRWAKNFDRWLARTQRLEVAPKTETADASTIGPRRGGVSVELVAIVWELV